MDSVVFLCGKLHPRACCNWSELIGRLKIVCIIDETALLGEDACQTRTGPVPSLLAQLNSTVLSLMDRAGVRHVARQMRSFAAHCEQALALLLTGYCSVY